MGQNSKGKVRDTKGEYTAVDNAIYSSHVVTSKDAKRRSPVVKKQHSAWHELIEMLRLCLPITLTGLLEYLPCTLCVVLVGHMDSPKTKEYSDAAILSTTFIYITTLAVGMGLNSAIDTLCSQAFGAQQFMKMGIYLQASMIVMMALVIPLSILNWFAGDLLLLLGQDEEIVKLASDFIMISTFGIPFVLIFDSHRRVLQAQSIAEPFIVMGAVVNFTMASVGYWMTYHTSLGFYGTAIAFVISRVTMLVCLGLYYWITKSYKSFWPGWNLQEAMGHVRQYLSLGIPGMLMLMMEWWAYEILALLCGVLPDPVITMNAHVVLNQTCTFVYMFFMGVSVASSIRVGNALGSNRPYQARQVCRIGLLVAAATAGTATLMIWLFRHEIPHMFLKDDEAIERAVKAMKLLYGFVIVDAVNCVMQGVFNGVGKQDAAAITNGIAYYLFGIPVGAWLAFKLDWSVEGLWLGYGFGVFLSFVTLVTILSCSSWPEMAKEALKRAEVEKEPDCIADDVEAHDDNIVDIQSCCTCDEISEAEMAMMPLKTIETEA